MVGPTGKYPAGKLGPHDEGELALRIAGDEEHDVVVVDFGTQVVSLAMPPEQAIEFGKLLIRQGMGLIDRQRERAGKGH